MKALYFSIASACVVGVLTGGVMKLGPDALADRPLGPQILLSGATTRVIDTDGWYANAILVNNKGEVPEYVIGADWARPAYIAVATDEPVAYEPVAYEPVAYEPVAYEAEKARAPAQPAVYTHPQKPQKPDNPQPVSYPSVEGDVVGPRDAPSEPQVVSLDDYESDTLTS